MTLFKYIGFDKPYWNQPLLENQLYFSSIEQLRKGNDADEFNHTWDTSSYFFSKYHHPIKEAYEKLFNNARVLCMGKNLNKTCWFEFCCSGSGVCYEFLFDESKKVSDLTSQHVKYNDKKNYNTPSFMIRNASEKEIKRLFSKESELSKAEVATLNDWIDKGHARHASMAHIVDELTFTKVRKFRKEKEYRFIHPYKPMDNKTTPLSDSKLGFEKLGLHLVRIYSSDIPKVKAVSNNKNLQISKPSFL